MKAAALFGFCSLSFLAGLGVFALAFGPLSPPAGPVASTLKPLAEIEPRTAISAANTPGDANSVYRITQPGSYYLTGNIVGGSGRHGIEVVTSDVTIDLNGFRLSGATGSLDGINIEGSRIAIRNGVVTGWGGNGVAAPNGLVGGRFDDLRIENCGGDGFHGVLLIQCHFARCESSFNQGDGWEVGIRNTFMHCAAHNNIVGGLITGESAVLEGCIATGNRTGGLRAGAYSTLTRCTSRNAVNDGAAGIRVENGSIVTECTSSGNGGIGIYAAGDHCHISRCSASLNDYSGIAVLGHCHVLENSARANGQNGSYAGILVTNASSGIGNRIEGNNCSENDTGIWVGNEGNVIFRNTCSGNTTANYSIVAGNTAGAIIAAVGATVTTSNSYANFEY